MFVFRIERKSIGTAPHDEQTFIENLVCTNVLLALAEAFTDHGISRCYPHLLAPLHLSRAL